MNEDRTLNLLRNAVGSEYATNDKAILAAYSRDQHYPFVKPQMPDYVVRPKSTEEVQKVLRIANRYRIPVIPMSSGINVRGLCVPEHGGIILELKEMDRFEIHEDMMTATVQPGVTLAKLSEETRKKGLKPAIPGAPSTLSPVSNFMLRGVYHDIVSTGVDQVRTMEVVLPNGDIIQTGSRAFPNAGPHFRYYGPDLAGLFQNQPGVMGVVTELTCQLFEYPEKSSTLINTHNDMKRACDFSHEIAMEEIAEIQIVLHWSDLALTQGLIKSEDDIDKLSEIAPPWVTFTVLRGSEKWMEYSTDVTEDILERYPPDTEFKNISKEILGIANMPAGEIIPIPPELDYILNEFRYPRGIGHWFSLGNYWAFAWWGPMNKVPKYYDETIKIWEDVGLDPKVMDFVAFPVFPYKGQNTYIELDTFLNYQENPDAAEMLADFYRKAHDKLLELGIYGWFRPYAGVIDRTMPHLKGEKMKWWRKLKELVDPNNIMNPGKVFPD